MALDALRHGPDAADGASIEHDTLWSAGDGKARYGVVAITPDGRRLPIDAREIEILMGDDKAGRPITTTIDLSANEYGHRHFEIRSIAKDHRDPSTWMSVSASEMGGNCVMITIRYDEDRRDDAQVDATTISQAPATGPARVVPAPERQKLAQHFRQEWDGITQEATLKFGWNDDRRAWAQALELFDWPRVLDLLQYGANPNDWQLSGARLNTALHWAAEGGADIEVVNALVERGGWRNIANAAGDIPFDIALRKGHMHLLDALKPVPLHSVEPEALRAIQAHFHQLLQWPDHIRKHQLRRPDLGPLLELEDPKMYFRVPGMYGGYTYWLDTSSARPRLIVESRCRIVGGSVPRHEIDVDGCKQVESVNTQ